MTLKMFLYVCTGKIYLSTNNDSWPALFRSNCIYYASLFTEIKMAEREGKSANLFNRKIKSLSDSIYTEYIEPINTIEIILEEEENQ